jgi:NADH-quinone oxidoreductase subunit M
MTTMFSGIWQAGLPALFAPLAIAIAVAAWLALPREMLRPRDAMLLLATLLSMLVGYAADSLPWIALGFTASLLITALALHLDTGRGQSLLRPFLVYSAVGTFPLLAAVWMTRRADVSEHQELVFWLLAVAAIFRSAVFPLHSWMPALIERGPLWSPMIFLGAPLGPLLLLRTIPLYAPDVAKEHFHTLAVLAIASALYCGFVSLSQRDLRRTIGYVLCSQSALALSGLCEPDAESVHGALLQRVAMGITSAGLLLVVANLEARTGTTDLMRLQGQGRRFGKLTAAFFVLSAAALGLPGTLHFVAEDLLLHGLLRTNAFHAVGLLLSTVLCGIALLRLFFRVFQGPDSPAVTTAHASDVGAREGLVLAALVLAAFGLGLFPQHALHLVNDGTAQLPLEQAPAVAAHGGPELELAHP